MYTVNVYSNKTDPSMNLGIRNDGAATSWWVGQTKEDWETLMEAGAYWIDGDTRTAKQFKEDAGDLQFTLTYEEKCHVLCTLPLPQQG